MSNTPSVALCVICHNRPAELHSALASASEFDEVIVVDMASEPPIVPVSGVRWLRSDENLWVAGGRNLLAREAGSDVLAFLDDDAVFATPAAGARISTLFAARDRPAAVAFEVVRPTGEIEPSEYPFRGRRVVNTRRECAYFLGGAVAIRRDAFDAAGGYDARYLYSTEEIDLAFAMQRDGETLLYDPSIVVEHRPSSHGRAPNPALPALRLRNRLMLVRRHLPWSIGLLHIAAWSARTFGEARRADGIREWLGAWREGLTLEVDRRPLKFASLARIHARGGRVLW